MSGSLPALSLIATGVVVVLSVVLLRRGPLPLLLELVLTAILTLAVLVAIGVAWSALWWLLQRWGA